MKQFIVIGLLILNFSFTYCQTETKYPKEVKVNWDTKVFENPLPIDEPFILVVYSQQDIPALTLMRYLDRNIFYYYEQPIAIISEKKDVAISGVTKQTIKATDKDGVTTTETTTEYNGDQVKVPRVRKYRVAPLRANFYYSLLTQSTYEAGSNAKELVKDGLSAKKGEGAITNTYLSYQDYGKRRVTAIIGVSYFNAETKSIRPYLGLRYNFIPINRELLSKYYDEMHYQGSDFKKIISRFSFDLGISLASIEDSARNQYDLFGKSNLLTGLGYKISDGFFISTGAMWYNKKVASEPTDIRYKITPAWYFSISFDWDFGKSLEALKKSLGASF